MDRPGPPPSRRWCQGSAVPCTPPQSTLVLTHSLTSGPGLEPCPGHDLRSSSRCLPASSLLRRSLSCLPRRICSALPASAGAAATSPAHPPGARECVCRPAPGPAFAFHSPAGAADWEGGSRRGCAAGRLKKGQGSPPPPTPPLGGEWAGGGASTGPALRSGWAGGRSAHVAPPPPPHPSQGTDRVAAAGVGGGAPDPALAGLQRAGTSPEISWKGGLFP